MESVTREKFDEAVRQLAARLYSQKVLDSSAIRMIEGFVSLLQRELFGKDNGTPS